MKYSIGRSFFRLMVYALLSAAIPLLLSACQTEDAEFESITNLVGTWNQSSRTVNGINATKDSTRLLLQINANYICILCDSTAASVKANAIVKRSGWSYNSGLFNLAVDMPAAWTATPSSSTLIMERSDFKLDGTISKTVLQFNRVDHIDIN